MLKNKKGFTLMEMLIVVAIIAVLIAIAIPVMNSALEKAREAADIANIRAAYAEAMVNYLDDEADASATTQKMTQRKEGWDHIDWPEYLGTEVKPVKDNVCTVTVEDGEDGIVVSVAIGEASDSNDSAGQNQNP